MALPAFLEAMNFVDVATDIMAQDWAAGSSALTVARTPTAIEAAQGTAAVGGIIGFEPAAKAVVAAATKRKAPPSIEPNNKKLKLSNRPNVNNTIQTAIQNTTGNLEEEDMNAIGESVHMRIEDRLSGQLPNDKFTSLSNSPVPQQLSAKSMQSTTTVDEVPIMPAGRVSKSHPDYFTVDLPFYQNFGLTLTTGDNINYQFIRLDSPYDPVIDGQVISARQPLGRDTWAGIYDFYRVLEADVTMIFSYKHGQFGNNKTTSPVNWDGDDPYHVCVGYYVTDDSTDVPANNVAFVEMKHSKASYIHPTRLEYSEFAAPTTTIPDKAARIHTSGGTTAMSFHYTPDDWDYHVTNLGLSERWTPKDAVPDFTHALGIVIAYPNQTSVLPAGERLDVQVDLYIKYKTQWREVNSTKKRTIDAS